MTQSSIVPTLDPDLVDVEPELSRVSVIGGNTQVDIALPATVPIAAYIADVVALIESRNPDLSEHDEGAVLHTRHWTLARLGQGSIPPHQSLTDAQVYDGELLVLRSVTSTEPPALFDDVIDAVSRLTTSAFGGWSAASARWTGLVAAVAAAAGASGLLMLSRAHQGGLAPALVGAGVGVIALVASVLAARFYAADVTATALELCGLALVFGGAALAVPGRLGSPHLLLGCVATLFAAVVTFRVGGVGATVVAAVITVAVLGGLAATVHMVWEPAVPKAAAGLLVAAIALISATPRSAVALARLPVPPVPTAGAAIDPVDQDERPTIEGIGVIGATALPSAAGLEQRARAANRYQSGMVVGCTITAVTAGFATADPFGATRWQGVALAVVAGLVLCLRGRAFADLTQAAAMIGGGCAGLVSVAIALAIGHPALLVPAAGVLIGSAIAAILFGAVGPSIEVSPVTRRKFELFEYLLIVSIVPLVFWTMDLYALARNR